MFSWFLQWNKFENCLIFDEVKAYWKVPIFGPPYLCVSNSIELTNGHNRHVLDKSDHSLHQTEQFLKFLKRVQIHPYVMFQLIFCVNL